MARLRLSLFALWAGHDNNLKDMGGYNGDANMGMRTVQWGGREERAHEPHMYLRHVNRCSSELRALSSLSSCETVSFCTLGFYCVRVLARSGTLLLCDRWCEHAACPVGLIAEKSRLLNSPKLEEV